MFLLLVSYLSENKIKSRIQYLKLEITITVPIHGEEIDTDDIKQQLIDLYGDENVDVDIIDNTVVSTTNNGEYNGNDNDQFERYRIELYIVVGIVITICIISGCAVLYRNKRHKTLKTMDIQRQVELNKMNKMNVEMNTDDIDQETHHQMISRSNSPIGTNDDEKLKEAETNRDDQATYHQMISRSNSQLGANCNDDDDEKLMEEGQHKTSFVVETETETKGNEDANIGNDEFVITPKGDDEVEHFDEFDRIKTKGNMDEMNPNIDDNAFIIHDNDITKC